VRLCGIKVLEEGAELWVQPFGGEREREIEREREVRERRETRGERREYFF
jgi:hypothetical protein